MGDEFVSKEYWAEKENIKLHIFRRQLASSSADGSPKPISFFVHGSSYAGITGHDLEVPGREDYSLMNTFARLGYDVWSMDHEGYGFSGLREGANSDIASGVEDLKAATDIIIEETGVSSFLFSAAHFVAQVSVQRRRRKSSSCTVVEESPLQTKFALFFSVAFPDIEDIFCCPFLKNSLRK